MRRILIICACVIGALIASGFLGAMWLFNTGAGRSFIIARAEPLIGDALNSEVEIGALTGAPPGRLVLSDITFSDQDGLWLEAGTVAITWRPLKLLRGAVDVSLLEVDSAHLLRPPPEGDDSEDEEPVDIALPNDLPDVRIDEIILSNFQSSVGGETARLDGVGQLAIGGAMINARLNLTSQNDADTVDIALELSPDAERLFIDATVAAQPGGVITALASLDGPLFVNASGDSPADNALIDLSAMAGDYGMLDGELSGDFQRLTDIGLTARFTPGPALSDIDELATPVTFAAMFTQSRNDAVLTLSESDSAIGAITGKAEWARKNNADLAIDLTADFAEDYRADIQDYVGSSLRADMTLSQRREDYAFALNLVGDGVETSITDGVTNLDNFFTGALLATMQPREGTPFPPSEARLEGRLQIDTDDAANLAGFTITLADGSSAGGDISFSFADETLRLNGDVEAAPSLIETLTSLKPSGAVRGAIEVEGPIDRFTAKASANTPAVLIGENTAPPLTIDAAFAGLPMLPTGELTARAVKGDGQLRLAARSSEDGTINITELAYLGAGFRFNGEGALNPDAMTGNIDASYSGEEDAEPWPGLPLVGAFNIAGEYSKAQSLASLTATAGNLQSSAFSIAGLSVNAQGNAETVAFDGTADRLILPGAGAIDEFSTEGDLLLRDEPRMRFDALNGVFSGNAFSLRAPATVAFSEGVAIDNLAMNWGAKGRIALTGAITDARWRADLNLTDVNVPQADSQITLSLDLDTDNETPARGDFQLTSLLSTAQSAAIGGAFLWDRSNVILNSDNSGQNFDMRISLPARLTTDPAVSVDTNGALDGYARYEGPADVIAAYLPPELQTIEGLLSIDVTLDGETEDPKISGGAAITGGAYTELQTGLSLAGLHLEADAEYASEGSVVRFSGGARGADQSGDDTIILDGAMNLDETPDMDVTLRLENTSLSAFPVNTVRANGEIKVAGPLDAIEASGAVTIDELDAEIVTPEDTGLAPIEVVAYDGETGAPPQIETKPGTSIGYDLSVVADDRIFVRGRGLESEWAADIKIVDGREQPLITGAMTLRRGWLDFSGRRFDLTRGRITFDRLSANNPLLDIRAELGTSDGVTAIIAVSGRADAPTVELTSTPSMPSEDIMALVLFGKPAGELTALESLQTAQALASLGGIGPFGGAGGVTSSIREAVGLDLLNVDIDPENGGGSLTVGKYVADGFFVSATQDAQGESGAVRVEYEITDNISVQTEVRQDGDQTYSANWKRDF